MVPGWTEVGSKRGCPAEFRDVKRKVLMGFGFEPSQSHAEGDIANVWCVKS